MRPYCLGLILMWTALPMASAQKEMQQVSGKVINERDGRPVAHANVSLNEERSHTNVAMAVSGDDGSFRFDSVPAGRYELSGQAPGYLRSFYLHHEQFYSGIVTGAGFDTGNLVLQLIPASSISGRLTDDTGEPLQQGRVALYREDPTATIDRVRRMRMINADDDGEFEFDDLEPGRYFVSANGNPWYAVHPIPEPEGASFPYRNAVDPVLDVAYATVFYPNALSSDAASPINLEGGEQVTADMRMVPQHALTITVQHASGEALSGRNVQLFASVFGSEEPVPVQMMVMNGVQTVVGIAPGQYRMDEFAPGNNMLVRSQEVNLTSGSISLNAVPPSALATLRVTVQPAPGKALPGQLSVDLQSPNSNRTYPGQASTKGTVEFHGVPAGEYRIAAFGEGRVERIAAISVDGHTSAGRTVSVTGTGDLAATATLAGDPVKIEGVVRHDGKPVPGSMIVLVPAGAEADQELFRRDQSDLDGGFTLNQVVPGKYILIAIDDGWQLRWNDAGTLMPYLLHGIPISVPGSGGPEMHLRDPVTSQSR